MKNIIVYLSAMLLFATIAFGAVGFGNLINTAWDANTETDLAGYRIYRSSQSNVYTFGVGSPNLIHQVECSGGDTSNNCTSYSFDDTPIGTWFWVATAYDSYGNESGPSDELTETITDMTAPSAPENFRREITP